MLFVSSVIIQLPMSQLSAKCCPQISAIRSHPQHCQGGSQGKAPPSNLNTLSNYQTPTYKHVFDKRHTSEIFLVGSFSPCTVHVPIHQHHLDAIVKIIDNFKEKTKQNTHPRNLTTKGFFFSGPHGSVKRRVRLLFKRGFQNRNLCRPQNRFQAITQDFIWCKNNNNNNPPSFSA